MARANIFHALGLHMHQPPGNLRLLIDNNPWEAQQIIHCYDRATRYAHKYPDAAWLHVSFSGSLLEQLRDPEVVERYRPHMDIAAMLASYRAAKNIELISTGYYHPVFPLIPVADWEEQLLASNRLMQEVFGRSAKGFCPPAFCLSPEMIPALVKAGYEYVWVERSSIRPKDGSALDPYQVYRASFGGASIALVPRDADLSNAQQYGLDPAWFANEAHYRVFNSPRPEAPRLVATWSDGENSEWFRRMDEGQGYFGHFFSPYIEHARTGEYPLQPVSLSAYLKKNPPQVEAEVVSVQWHSSQAQQDALGRIHKVSAEYQAIDRAKLKPAQVALLEQARRQILESETSCFLYWDNAWVGKVHERLAAAEALLRQATQPEPKPAPTPKAKPANATAKAVGQKAKSAAKAATPAAAPVAEKTPTPAAAPAKSASVAPAPAKAPAPATAATPKTPAPVEKPSTPAAQPVTAAKPVAPAKTAPAAKTKPAPSAAKPAPTKPKSTAKKKPTQK